MPERQQRRKKRHAPHRSGHRARHTHARAGNRESGREWLYGRRPVCECLRAARRRPHQLLLTDDSARGLAREWPEWEPTVRATGLVPETVERHALNQLLGEVNHQGVALGVSAYPYLTFPDIVTALEERGEQPSVLVLDHIEDPQNLGSLLRSADAAGIDGVLIPSDRAAGVTPAAVRASAGAAEHMHVARVTNLVRCMRALKDEGYWFRGLDAEGDSIFATADLSGKLGLVIGSEGKGLGRLVRETCDSVLSIPMRGRVASLNAGVAGAVAMYEILRRSIQSGDV